LLDHQNNYVRHSSLLEWLFKTFYKLHLIILHNYLDSSTKLFSDLYLVKFLDTSEKSFFRWDFILTVKISNFCFLLLNLSKFMDFFEQSFASNLRRNTCEMQVTLMCNVPCTIVQTIAGTLIKATRVIIDRRTDETNLCFN